MNQAQARELLAAFQSWRRWDGEGEGPAMPDPKEIGKALDVALRVMAEHDLAMSTLRQIATGDNRTRRKKLAAACVLFIDSISARTEEESSP